MTDSGMEAASGKSEYSVKVSFSILKMKDKHNDMRKNMLFNFF